MNDIERYPGVEIRDLVGDLMTAPIILTFVYLLPPCLPPFDFYLFFYFGRSSMSRVYDERPLLTHTHTPRDSPVYAECPLY